LPLLLVLGLVSFAAAVAIRLPDPLVPLIARDFGVSLTAAALVSSAYSLPYALGQPILGPMGDALGKARVMKVCLAIGSAAMGAAWLAPSFETLFAARALAGVAGGGSIPIAIAMIGDRFPVERRQVALARLLFAAVTGQLLGSIGSGLIGEAFGWRASFLVAFLIVLAAAVAAIFTLGASPAARRPLTWDNVRSGYARVFANPRAVVCYATVFAEGVLIYGVFPHLAGLFETRGVGSVREAGFAVGAFGLGGVLMTASVGYMLQKMRQFTMMRVGGVLAGAALGVVALFTPWQATVAAFVPLGFGFYMLHNSLQTQASELAPEARGSAVALHAFFFFLGIALGPAVIGLGFQTIGPTATILIEAAGTAGLGIAAVAAFQFRGRRR
jgi:predicted MFS family arabinose efflux permease